ncbi:MAG: YkgJ family cysteine cluster protein [Verrucomicrobiales bacterium]|nr:YkgJ family cysteine cluster protein [Verrucomicrobiales bacterium]
MSRQKRRSSSAASSHDDADGEAELRSIYAALDARVAGLERNCQARTRCCRFQITGEHPLVTRAEARYMLKGVRASGRRAVSIRSDGACPLLKDDGRCSIYAFRPFGCRSHFCAAAGGMVARREIADLIQRLTALDEKEGGDGPRSLPEAVAAGEREATSRRRRDR